MLTHERHLRARAQSAGFSLAEITLALVLGALVIGLAAAVGGRLQRRLLSDNDRIALHEQLAAAGESLPIDLRGLSPGSDDIAPGEARDSSLQLRATIANGVVCDASAATLKLAVYLGPNGSSNPPAVQDGDTAWILVDADTTESWRPTVVRTFQRITGNCAALTDALGANVFDVAHLWSAGLRDSASATRGSIVRVTRPIRFSFYEAGDNRWYLGLRTWSSATSRFNTIQPISGPYAAASGSRGTRFEYFDSTGARLSSGAAGIRSIARVEAVLMSESSTPALSAPRDSLRVVVALRNRR